MLITTNDCEIHIHTRSNSLFDLYIET